MADRSVEVDVVANDKTAAGLDSASSRFKKFGDDVDKKSQETGDRAGRSLGSRLTGAIGGIGRGITTGLAKIGTVAGGKFGDAMSNAMSNASPQVQAAIGGVVAGAVATLAPLLGAGLSGAVIGAGAGAGIVGGVMLAVRDQRVQSAGTQLGQRIMAGLNSATAGGQFLAPVLSAINMIGERFDRLAPLIGRGLAAAARFVEPLTDALLDAGEAITIGLVAAVQKAGPVMDAIGDGIRMVGESIGNAFALLSTQSDNAASALRVIFAIISGAIDVIAQFVYILTAAWGAITTLGGLLGDDSAGVEKIAPDADSAKNSLGALIPALDETATSAGSASTAVAGLNSATRDLAGANASLDQSQISLNAALAATKQVREEGGKVTDAERSSLLNLNSEIQKHLAAMAAQGASADQVNAKSNTLRLSFIEQARAMGMSEQQAIELATRYGMFPKSVDTRVVLSGAARAKQELEWVEAAAGSIPAAINIAVRVTGSSNVGEVARSLAKQSMRADAFAAGHAEFAAAGGFSRMSRMAGATIRQGPANITLNNRLRVELDGKAMAPELARTASAVYDVRDWKRGVGQR